MSLKFGLLVLGVTAFVKGSAQDNAFKQVAPPSANAASLGKYGDIPVSYHTGVPNISIPIYTVTQGKLSVPITLNYHSSGIKVDELASWVGLGWSLNAGGVITRSVVGGPDEGNNRTGKNSASDIGYWGWFKDYGISPLITTNCIAHPAGTNLTDTVINGNYQVVPTDPRWNNCLNRNSDVFNGIVDTEPDIYNFNFAGYSGKFFFDSLRNPVMQPLQDLVIQPILIIPSSGTPYFDHWVVITPDGTRYYFGGPNATESDYFGANGAACNNCANSFSSSSWYLTKIVNMNKTDSIMFTYKPAQYSFLLPPAHTVIIPAATVLPIQGDFSRPTNVPNITMVNGYVLTQIATSSGNTNLNFASNALRQDVSSYSDASSPTNSATSLDAIEINSTNYQSTFQFGYSYFQSDATEGIFHNKRLRLDKLQESSSSQGISPYNFTYQASISLPDRLSFSKDHWGYYNGAPNQGLIPSFPSTTINVGGNFIYQLPNYVTSLANRNPDGAYMQAGVLQQIQYPTGGTTQFVYEPHLQNPSDPTSIVGGLRIKQILGNDGYNPATTKSFSYSEGILYAGMPNYVSNMMFNSSYPATLVTAQGILASGNNFGILVSSECRPAIKTTQGYHIGYTIVNVSDLSGGVANGASQFTYQNLLPTIAPWNVQYPIMPAEYVPGSGELLGEIFSDQNNKVLKSTTTTVASDFSQSIRALKIVSAHCYNVVNGVDLDAGMIDNPVILSYHIKTGRRLLTKKIEYVDGVSTTTFNRYSPNHNFPVQTTIINSQGRREDHFFNYSKDNYVFNCSISTTPNPPSLCLSTYNASVQPLFDQYVSGTGTYESSLDGASSSFSSCNAGTNSYLACVNNTRTTGGPQDKILSNMIVNNMIVPLGSKRKVNGVIVSADSTSYTMSPASLLVPFEKYEWDNSSGSLTRRATIAYSPQERMITYSKEKDVTTGYLWGYNNSSIIAEIKNASSSRVIYSSFESNTAVTKAKTGRSSFLGTVTVNLPAPGSYSLSYWSSPDGTTWTLNQSVITANTTIGNASTYIDEYRLYPVGAQLTTYTYDPGVGVTSVTDANNQSSYYSYDGLGRLVLVKDFQGNILKEYKYHYKQ